MDFTREPIIETVITPREGCKLVVRSSKSSGQEEYFVDAVEVVSFGHSFFFRSLERPKAFLVPVSDYEILEVREARMVLKNVGIDRAIKIGGGRDAQMRGSPREPQEKVEMILPEEEEAQPAEASTSAQQASQGEPKGSDARLDKKRDRRRHYRRRRGREEGAEGGEEGVEGKEGTPRAESSEPRKFGEDEGIASAQPITTSSILTSLLPPPPTLISETIAKYKENALFRDAFYTREEYKPAQEEIPSVPLEQPAYGSFEVSEEEEEKIYQQRKLQNARDQEGHEHEEGRLSVDAEEEETAPNEAPNDLFFDQEPPDSSDKEKVNNGNHHQ